MIMDSEYAPLPAPETNQKQLQLVLDQARHKDPSRLIIYSYCNQGIMVPCGIDLDAPRTHALFVILNMIGYATQHAMATDPAFKRAASRLAMECAELADGLLSIAGPITVQEAVNHSIVLRHMGRRPH